MTLDNKDLNLLRLKGIKISTTDGKEYSSENGEVKQLKEIIKRLDKLIAREDSSPTIEVKPADVVVNNPPANKPIKKWKFTLTRNSEGQLTTIVATAID